MDVLKYRIYKNNYFEYFKYFLSINQFICHMKS